MVNGSGLVLKPLLLSTLVRCDENLVNSFLRCKRRVYEFSSHRFVRSWFMTPAHNDMKAFVSFLFAQHDDTLIPEF